jgi:hypothetical protein
METKYQRWYDGLIARARGRIIPVCYTELHHVVPASFGGSDHPDNLVRLTYREHFIAHWLLTKTSTGGSLRKMQRALFAMTFTNKGERLIAGWQFEVAKRAIRDLELDPEAERISRLRLKEARAAELDGILARKKLADQIKFDAIAAMREHSEREAARLDSKKDRSLMWEMANSWAFSAGKINRKPAPAFRPGKPRKRNRYVGPRARLRDSFQT